MINMIISKNSCTILIVIITSVVREVFMANQKSNVKALHEASPGPKMPTGRGARTA